MEGMEESRVRFSGRNWPASAGITLSPADWRQGMVVASLGMLAAAALLFLSA